MARKNGHAHILQDVALIVLSILVAFLLVRTGVLEQMLRGTSGALASFIAGVFFTSIFTTAPAIAALGEISLVNGILPTALVGAIGSLTGDLIIFRFVKDRFSEDVRELLGHRSIWRRVHLLFRRRFFRWITFLIGGLILASPLPDELGVAVLGMSRMNSRYFAALSLIFNFIGIYVIGTVAHSIVG